MRCNKHLSDTITILSLRVTSCAKVGFVVWETQFLCLRVHNCFCGIWNQCGGIIESLSHESTING